MSPTPVPSTSTGSQQPNGGLRRPIRSRGIEVPDLVGRPAAGSVAELRKLGLKPNSVPEPVTDPLQAGTVIAQDPSAGEFVAAGTRVRIEIGDHSLFDPRKYDAPADPPLPLAETKIPPIPSPFELLGDDETAGSVPKLEPVGEPGLSTRWQDLDGSLGVEVEDPYADEQYPDFDPETGEIIEPVTYPTERPDPIEAYAHRPGWTRKQRSRVLLSFSVLLLLACVAVAAGLGSHRENVKHPAAATTPLARVRVVTLTVISPPPSVGHDHRS